MPQLLLNDVDDAVLRQLEQRAARHQRSPAEEAAAILADTLRARPPGEWRDVDAVYDRLAATGRSFSNSVDLLREDRDR